MASLEQEVENFENNPRKWFRKYILWIVGLVLLVGTIFYFVSWGTEAAEVAKDTYGPKAAKFEYEWFKTQYEDYQAIQEKITDQQKSLDDFRADLGPRKEWDRTDKIEYDRLNSIKVGLEQQKADIAAKYNAKSKMSTRNVFKSNDLPYQLED